jgi:hypothetical protein
MLQTIALLGDAGSAAERAVYTGVLRAVERA